jgi:(p)ppGpp synthase/HD superfamily hydrolase
MKHTIQQVKEFAINAHESINQRRKYSNEPYYKHCERVVQILSKVTDDEDILAAAWMHDILEDVAPKNPDYSEKKIHALFGDKICDMVLALTDASLDQGNRATRKALDRKKLGEDSADIKTIKLADILDNFNDIAQHDPGFAKVFAQEIKLLLPCLIKGDKRLFDGLAKALNEYYKC